MADDIKPVDGKTTIDEKVMFEAQRLSYDASRVIAEKIAWRISERTKTKQVVVASGSNRVQHSLWSSIISGDGLSSSGGAVVAWAILNVNGGVEPSSSSV